MRRWSVLMLVVSAACAQLLELDAYDEPAGPGGTAMQGGAGGGATGGAGGSGAQGGAGGGAPACGVVLMRGYGDAADDRATAVTAQSDGTVVIAGEYDGSIDLGIMSHTSAAQFDGFIVALDDEGTAKWRQYLEGVGEKRVSSIAVHASNEIALGGQNRGSMQMPLGGSGSLLSTDVDSGFVLRMQADGNDRLWWQQIHNATFTQTQFVNDVATSGAEVYAAGAFRGAQVVIDIDTNIASGGTADDGFVVRYDSQGEVIDSLTVTGSANQTVTAVAPAGVDVYLGGATAGMVFGLPITGPTDAFVANFTEDLTTRHWAVAIGGSGRDTISDMVSVTGGVVVVGTFEGTITFPNDTYTSNGGEDGYVVKLDATDGTALWSMSFGGLGDDAPLGVAVDTSGNVLVTGKVNGSAVQLGETSFTTKGDDALVLELSSVGKVLGARVYGSAEDDVAAGIAVLPDNGQLRGVVVVGEYAAAMQIGTQALEPKDPVGPDADAFVLRFAGDVNCWP